MGTKVSKSKTKTNPKDKKPKKKNSDDLKILLIGSGESGKSTLFKQLKLIHDVGFTQDDAISHRDIIRSNVIISMKSLIAGAKKLDIPFTEEQHRDLIKKFDTYDTSFISDTSVNWKEHIGDEILELWKDSTIKETYKRRNEFQLLDSTEYFFNKLDEIKKKGVLSFHRGHG